MAAGDVVSRLSGGIRAEFTVSIEPDCGTQRMGLSRPELQELIRIAARLPFADAPPRAGTRHEGTSSEQVVEALRAERDQV